ncbi:hypothetical protein ABZP36_021024 [Zizania latifolia]
MAPRIAALVVAVAFAAVLLSASAQDFNAPSSSPAPAPTSGAAGGFSALAVASSALGVSTNLAKKEQNGFCIFRERLCLPSAFRILQFREKTYP